MVGQIETAALKKVSDNRNNPFERELTHMYTAATYVLFMNIQLGTVNNVH